MQADILSNLIAHYPLDDTSGPTAADTSGNNLHGILGTAAEAPQWQAPCRVGGCLSFDGGDLVNLPTNALFNITGNITLAAWVKTAAVTENAYIIGGSGDWPFNGYRFRLAGAIPQYAGSEPYSVSNTSVLLNAWHHVAVTVAGTTVTFYLDGFVAGVVPGVVPGSHTGLRQLGAGAFHAADRFNGQLDEIYIFARALTSNDILELVAYAPTPVPPTGYTPAFSDEFDSGVLNLAKWSTYHVCWNLRTISSIEHLQYYIESGFGGLGINPHPIAGGTLSLVTNVSPNQAATGNLPYYSAMISTEQSNTQLYGYYEARLRLPAGQGFWPAIWMIPSDCGDHLPEMDVLEVLGHQPSTLYQYSHPNEGDNATQYLFGSPVKIDFVNTTEWHVYGFEWTAAYQRWLIDGRETHRVVNYAFEPHYYIINLAVGGDWPGNPNETTPFPSAIEIDYVRIYTATPEAPTGATRVIR